MHVNFLDHSPNSRPVHQTLGVTLAADTDRARVSLEKQIGENEINIAYPSCLPLNRRRSGHDVDTALCRYTPRPAWKLTKRENAIYESTEKYVLDEGAGNEAD